MGRRREGKGRGRGEGRRRGERGRKVAGGRESKGGLLPVLRGDHRPWNRVPAYMAGVKVGRGHLRWVVDNTV